MTSQTPTAGTAADLTTALIDATTDLFGALCDGDLDGALYHAAIAHGARQDVEAIGYRTNYRVNPPAHYRTAVRTLATAEAALTDALRARELKPATATTATRSGR